MKVALFGKIRSGKDTVGELLIKEYGCTRVAFGDGIKKIIDEFFPEAWDNGKPRLHYQHIGQELRKLNPDVWINSLVKRAEDIRLQNLIYRGDSTSFVVTDGRQRNEAVKLKEQGYTIVVVETDETTRIERMIQAGDNFSMEMLRHETERQVDLIEPDYIINNNGTLEDLKIKVRELVNELR
jgi:dephospho-CoA kinase